MRILIFPFYSNASNLNGCSAFNWAKGFIKWAVKNYPDVYFYLVFPEMDGNWHYRDDGFFKSERLSVIHVPLYPKGQRDSMAMAPKEFFDLFNERVGTVVFDAVFTDRIALVPIIKNALGHFVKSKRVNIPVVVKDHFLITIETAIGTPMDVEVQQAMGLACADRAIFQSPLTYERALRMMKKYLQPSLIIPFQKKSLHINFGVNCDVIDKYRDAEKYPMRTVLFSQRLEQNANWEFIFAVLDKMYRITKNVQVIVCTNNKNLKQLDKVKKLYSHFRVFSGMPQDKYLEIVSKCHIFVVATRFEEYPTVVFEALRMGLVGIVPQKEWVKRLMPVDYPFTFKDGMEALFQIKRLIEMPDEQLRTYRMDEWVKEVHSVDHSYAQVYETILDAWKTKKQVKISSGVMELIDEAGAKIGGKFPASMIYDSAKRHSEKKVPIGQDKGAYGMSKFMVREILLRLGYKDTCEREFPIYAKVVEEKTTGQKSEAGLENATQS